ncbi:MAG: protein translocase subunit SecF [Sciscionella sp.]
MATNGTTAGPAGASGKQRSKGSLAHRLYNGTGAFDIVGKRKRFYIAFALLIVISALSMGFRGFNFGIDFTGGTQIQFPASGTHGTISTKAAGSVYADTFGHLPEAVQSVGNGGAATIQIRSVHLDRADAARVEHALFEQLGPKGTNGQPSQAAISDSAVSASWGGQISRQAVIALVVFLVLVGIFLAFYFERWMSVAALIALGNDVVVTAGIYSLVGFEVTPATVIGLLTILGFSLYDTVVVFDKVRENTKGLLGLTRRSYPEAANLALNQTLMRSINTSLIALLPVLGLLVVGVGLLGVGTLTDLALVQLIGMLSGASSSIMLATPLLVDMKMREKPYQQQAAKVNARREQRAAKRQAESASGAEAARTAGDELTDEPETDQADERQERAMAAAASVPARTVKRTDAKRSRPTGKRRR